MFVGWWPAVPMMASHYPNGSSQSIASTCGDNLTPFPQSAIWSAAQTALGWFGHPSDARLLSSPGAT
jgi:hypothetical protein